MGAKERAGWVEPSVCFSLPGGSPADAWFRAKAAERQVLQQVAQALPAAHSNGCRVQVAVGLDERPVIAFVVVAVVVVLRDWTVELPETAPDSAVQPVPTGSG